ncbi:DUF2382 domain-containing protein [Blastococcus saxobsidens]|uniref:DUF2382 domain-containing protein n=1 Tax=Blastococcus saxobsidens (strain DD2) TaxID=1146883 RepID=H6RWA5_BLASD|nr:conserved protein of unknown function, putative PRC-barrel domain [Blastococcus saxobsidens DD2]
MITEQQLNAVIGSTAVGPDGKLGTVGEVYLDDETGRPEWATVRTGLFGTKEAFVPLASADISGGELRMPYDKDKVKNAPHIDSEGHLSPAEESELYRYYGLETAETATPVITDTSTDTPTDTSARGAVGHNTSGPTTDNAMTRSEEQLRVGTERVESGRARLRKHVVSQTVSQTVPVTHEEVRVEREPITDADVGNALDGPAISEEEHEVVLHGERPVVQKEAVPVERVRLDTETVTEQATVDEQVRKEQIELDGDGTAPRRLTRRHSLAAHPGAPARTGCAAPAHPHPSRRPPPAQPRSEEFPPCPHQLPHPVTTPASAPTGRTSPRGLPVTRSTHSTPATAASSGERRSSAGSPPTAWRCCSSPC